MYDLATVGPPPENLATRVVFEKVRVPLSRLADLANAANLLVDGRTFIDCVITGPCVVMPTTDTRFADCNMGDTAGDMRNLFLKAVGPAIIGAIPLYNCSFQGCLFMGVGFAGDDAFVEGFSALLSGKEP